MLICPRQTLQLGNADMPSAYFKFQNGLSKKFCI